MTEKPRTPRPSRLFIILIGIILLIVVATFVGMNISHYHEMKGATPEPPRPGVPLPKN